MNYKEKIIALLNDKELSQEQLEHILSQLKDAETEDERMRKNCIHFLELQKTHHAATFEIEECIAWLEKQGEKKPAEWSEEDEMFMDELESYITFDAGFSDEQKTWRIKRLKSLKPQPKQEWSEEDEYMLNETIQHLEILIRMEKNGVDCDSQYYQRDIEWLKSLKDRVQPQWKPSDEQMSELNAAFNGDDAGWDDSVLESLYNDLKKLREE